MGSKKDKNRKYFLVLAIILVVIFFGLWLWSYNNNWTRSANQTSTKQVFNTTTASSTPTDYLSSFSDLFSGTAWLDVSQTNLYRDGSAMVLTFPPLMQWQEAGDCQTNPSDCQKVDEFLSNLNKQRFCRQQNCLEIRQDQLFYNNLNLPWPGRLLLINTHINQFGDRWLVAGVRKISDKQYQPLAWWFDGQDFQSINLPGKNGQLAKSEYLGQFGTGGRSDSLLILYSAYDGLAWQLKDNQIHDLSYFWGIRVNGGGFAPAVISVGQGNKTNWYIFNRGPGTPHWLKLWQNNTGWIEGSLDFSDRLPASTKEISFLPTSTSQPNFIAKVSASDGQQWLLSFKDNGFDVSQPTYQVYSANLTTYDSRPPQITRAVIIKPVGGWSGLKNSWFISPDQQQWLLVEPDQMAVFSSTTSKLWWRWQVKPTHDAYQSPCLKMISLNYYRL